MKFKKLAFGLAFFPLLLTSCNRALTFEQAKQWVAENYKTAKEQIAIATVEWDVHSTTGPKAKDYVKRIFVELGTEQKEAGLVNIIPTELDFDNPIDHKIRVNDKQIIEQLNSTNFKAPFSEDVKNDVYKVNNGGLTVTYKHTVEFGKEGEDPEKTKVETTRVRVYNSEGFCTDFGCKVNGKWIDDDNTMKFKILIHFTYEDDPID